MHAWTVLVAGCYAFTGVAACGGGAGQRPDAAVADDAPDVRDARGAPDAQDVPPDAAVALCHYTETADATNDPTLDRDSGSDAAESTGLIVGSEPRTLCGVVNVGHFDGATHTVDNDAYRVTVERAGNLIVRFAGAEGASAVADFSVYLRSGNSPVFGASLAPSVHDHGLFVWSVPPGDYDVMAAAQHPSDLDASFGYKVQLALDRPSRCAQVAGAPAYREAAGEGDAGNDVLMVDFRDTPHGKLTASTSDAAEATGLVLDNDTRVLITGSSADRDRSGDDHDEYLDRDTYEIRTGAATTELTLRLDWADPQVNLDYFIFPAEQTAEVGGSSRFDGNEEYNIVAVKPNTAYWIWIGASGDRAGLPAGYDLTVCGESVSLR